MDEGQRTRLRRIVTDMANGGDDMTRLPRHKIDLVEGRQEEAAQNENGAGFG